MATVDLATVCYYEGWATAIPTVGTYRVGDRLKNRVPTAGGNAFWSCVTAGTPGTWQPFGNIAPISTAMSFNTQTGSYTLALGDAADNVLVVMNVAGANNLTVPLNASVAFAVGAQIEILQLGAGQTTIVGATVGVTVNKTFTLKMAAQYARATLLQTAINVWVVSGEMALT